MQAIPISEAFASAIDAMQEEVQALIRTLCAIPAPSHHEEKRAEFVKNWFEQHGMHAEIDEAKNVLCPMGLDDHEEIVVVMAHMDTVFPDTMPMPFREEGGRMYCPGVGDDTANLAAMMLLARYFHQHGTPRCGVLFVGDACEEGLGNLDGCRAIMKAFGPRVKTFLSLDGDVKSVCAHAVGSYRYKITAKTKGGHSFVDFGNRSAIEALCRLTCALYNQKLPQNGDSITTYNVGIISGGTSVNTIAQEAEMLYEFRSDDPGCLAVMEKQMRTILEESAVPDAQIHAQLLGERPCGKAGDKMAQLELENACCQALERYVGRKPGRSVGSTDCNIPLSMGIPSACFGMYVGEGEHTREEWIEPASLQSGMKAAASVLLNWLA